MDEERSRNVKEAGASFPSEQEFRQEKRSSGRPSFINRDIKKSPARLDLAGKNAFNCWQDKVFRLSGGGEPSGPPAPTDSGMP